MSHEVIALPQDPAEAARALLEASREVTVVVFKKSPVCPTSHRAESQFHSWLEDRSSETSIRVAEIDVIAERSLARGLVAELGIEHQSPQALVFKNGGLAWHGSHDALTVDRFRAEVD